MDRGHTREMVTRLRARRALPRKLDAIPRTVRVVARAVLSGALGARTPYPAVRPGLPVRLCHPGPHLCARAMGRGESLQPRPPPGGPASWIGDLELLALAG